MLALSDALDCKYLTDNDKSTRKNNYVTTEVIEASVFVPDIHIHSIAYYCGAPYRTPSLALP